MHKHKHTIKTRIGGQPLRKKNYHPGTRKKRTGGQPLRKANCHPGTRKKKILDYSCFTKESILTLKEAFNNHHPEKQIITDNPKEIWAHLHQKIPECDQESCWLQKIPNRYLQDKLKKDLFSPVKPTEWKAKPNAWLSNFDIDAVIQQYEEANRDFLFLGPTPIDFDKVKTDSNFMKQMFLI
jgi:hypothetical protein